MPSNVVEFENVDKDFKKLRALRDVSFTIGEGEIFGFVGPNGCGKTTTIRLALGIYKPNRGMVRVFGRNPCTQAHQFGLQVGVMLEQPGMVDDLTADEYLEYFGGIFRLSSTDTRTISRELLKLLGLSDRAKSLLKTFSKGMRQRLSLARCLLNRPRLIVLDEPFDGLDAESRRLMLDILPQVSKKQGTTIFITSHNLAEIEELSHRVAIIKQGHIVAMDDMESLRRRAGSARLLVVNLAQDYPRDKIVQLAPSGEYRTQTHDLVLKIDPSNGNCDDLLKRLLQSGISVNSMRTEIASLEDVYFALTKEPENKL
ncbi:MAG: ABC transporter ATP-binding protein [Verrucomicrobiota bacterium]